MAAQGTATVDFGTGATDARVTVSGQTGITNSSLAEAWVWPIATASNTADDTLYSELRVIACNVVAGSGFDIVVMSDEGIAHGIHTVAWVWN